MKKKSPGRLIRNLLLLGIVVTSACTLASNGNLRTDLYHLIPSSLTDLLSQQPTDLLPQQPTDLLSEKSPETFSAAEKLDEPISKDATLISVPYLNQSDELPTGCEVVSAAMLLQFYGYNIDPTVLANDYLKTSPITVSRDELIGDSPNDAFIGSPYDSRSYGCYAPVIVEMLDLVLVKSDHQATLLTELSLSDIETQYLQKQTPVLIWATIDMKAPVAGSTWTLRESGQQFTWIAPEHCVVLVGYDETHYYINDPYQNRGVVRFPKKLVSSRYQALGKQAVVLT